MLSWTKRLRSSTEIAGYRLSRWDVGAAVAVALATFALYLRTMPPSILDGDSGRWQYVCYVLGIPYVTGYPSLVLLGKLWSLLVPIGSLAYRFSLLSVVLGAVSAGLSYLLFRKSVGSRPAAVLSAVCFATLPTTWWWSISMKAYALNLVFVSGCFVLLLQWSDSRREGTLRWFALLYGLSLTNHSTMSLFAPAFVAFILLHDWAILRSPRRMIVLFLLFLAPLLLYLYIPLRGHALWTANGTQPGLPWPVSVSRGLISSEYEPTWQGFWRLVLATADTKSLLTHWERVPRQLATVYGGLVSREFAWPYLVLALAGAVRLLVTNLKKAVPVLLGFLAFPPFVIKYGHGMQSAFLLPSNLMVALCVASALAGVFEGLKRLGRPWPVTIRYLPYLVAIGLTVAFVSLGTASRFEKMDRTRDYAVRDYWYSILRHPLEDGAGLLAHSGVLTPLWYIQQTEGQRADLFGLFPPTDEVVRNWLKTGHSLYLAGPLEGWLPKAWEHYRLTPWGILVRIAPYDSLDESEALKPQHALRATFGDSVEMLGYDLTGSAVSGGTLPLHLHWRTARRLPVGYLVSLRLVAPDGQRVSGKEDRLVSAWYPESTVPEGRFMLDVFDVPIPAGTLPGTYRLQLVLHHPETGEELAPAEGISPFTLADVQVVTPERPARPDPAGLAHISGAVFGDEIGLVGYSVDPLNVKQGQSLSLEALWQMGKQPAGDYHVLAQLVEQAGGVRWEVTLSAAQGGHPPSTWKPGELVRHRYVLDLPADLAGGEYTLRIGWMDAAGHRLQVRTCPWSSGDTLALGQVSVVERARQFDVPKMAVPVEADFADQVRLLGYDLEPLPAQAGGRLDLTLYWQALKTLDTSYTVFVHLVDRAGEIRAQRDALPGQGTLPTTGWVKGEVIRDVYTLDLDEDLPEGEYSLLVGLYDVRTGARLSIGPAGGAGSQDHILLMKLPISRGSVK